MIRSMQQGSVVIDVSVDQGGCIETIHYTTHSRSTYIDEGVIHYGITNMLAIVPRTSTYALSKATLPYVMELAAQGAAAIKANPALTS